MAWIAAQIDFMIAHVDVERLRQLTWPRTQAVQIFDTASRFHQTYSARRFESANQNQSISRSVFHEHVEHPMDAVIKVDVACAGFVSLDETACTRTTEGVRRFVVFRQVRFRFDDQTCASPPDQSCSD